ncbi:MAG TPA: nitroreductase family protein [Syntrophales bacterium]|nr:nitroreductase family protein [Syntrophales bacterium]HPX10865.1 nitroreductase family protein [Syntrophales bacterium]HQB31291.1 nitroreductase family protein [Syntrophales bacterium]HQN78239.1 nitroreductase family protein [Syntrophales bacterium]HQQ27498.1 nitroreductase family protein [Syntrophales bacterium]
MDVMEAIFSRRSIRKFLPGPVSDEAIELLLRAAMAAPSAGNERPWHFIVIRDRGVLGKVPSFHPYSRMIEEVSAAILVCGDREQEKYEGCWMLDCAAATENLLLAARAQGLGAVWLGIYPETDRIRGMRDLVGLPENVIPLCIIPLGVPGEKKGTADRFDPARIRYDRWE